MLKKLNFNVRPETIVPQLTERLAANKQKIAQVVARPTVSWDESIAPLDDLSDALNQFWTPVSHLHGVADSESLRAAYQACLPKLSDYGTEVGQNKDLYEVYKKLHDATEFKHYSPARQKIIQNALRDFRLTGIELAPAQQARYKEIAARLAELGSQFEANLLDATHAWTLHITDEAELAGISAERKTAMGLAAERKNLTGWLVTLDQPTYFDVITYADNRKLREQVYYANTTRASDQGPQAGQFDNSAIITELLALRAERAKLLGYQNYAQLSLATKMADSPEKVQAFLLKLIKQVRPIAQRELAELAKFAQTQAGTNFKLEPWDVAYYSEKLRQQNYAVSAELVRTYLPAPKVIAGLFSVLKKLYGLELRETTMPTWHSDVTFYEIYDHDKLIGGIYFDLYAREAKRSGAWMDEAIAHRKTNAGMQLPIAFLTCNFSGPTPDKPALLTHDEVETLFHEMGHCLQHLLTEIAELGVSGINGVPWDAVEFPSQFFEAWAWQPECVQLLSAHYQTGKPLPNELIDKLIAAKNFQAALFLIRQLEFALFDITLHSQTDLTKTAHEVLQEIRKQVAVIMPPEYNRFENSFSHIFAGGYGAGYYSYLWAEVLARDAFSAFAEQGIFNQELGRKFRHAVLAQGGSQAPLVLFKDFMGREPDPAALLNYYQLT